MVRINLEEFQNLLKEIAKMNGDIKLTPILERMTLMANLLEDYSRLTNEQEKKELLERINTYRETNEEAINELLAEYNTSSEELKKQINNPHWFNKQDWECIQNLEAKLNLAITR